MSQAKKSKHVEGFISIPWRQHRLYQPFSADFPNFTKPVCVGTYSYSGTAEYFADSRYATYLCDPLPKPPFDLNEGLEKVVRKSDPPDHRNLESVLEFIRDNGLLKPDGERKRLDADFVGLRGVLRQIMCMQYERNRDMRLLVSRVNGTIYISKIEDKEDMSPEQLVMCSWGFKFEQFVTCAKPRSKPQTNTPVYEGAGFIGVFRFQLGKSILLYGAEVDSVRSQEPLDFKDAKVLSGLEFVELKTGVYNKTATQERTFRTFKSANWWSQSFLVDTKTIYVGLRDPKGIVQEISNIAVSDLARDKPWSPSAMAIFLERFLAQLTGLMKNIDDPHTVVQVDLRAKAQFATYMIFKGEQNQFLPDWYVDIVNSKN
ncbi:hypothetical protein KR018_005382 [Drosophila ironensis]|nr:hypothetical protein KR018_005382 [Drosophila ironensis]